MQSRRDFFKLIAGGAVLATIPDAFGSIAREKPTAKYTREMELAGTSLFVSADGPIELGQVRGGEFVPIVRLNRKSMLFRFTPDMHANIYARSMSDQPVHIKYWEL